MLTNNDILNLTEVFSKNNLLAYYVPLIRRFFKSAGFTEDMLKIPLMDEASQLLVSKKNLNKNELGIVCFCIFYNKEVFNAFLSCMPNWFGKLVEILLWQKELHRDEVEKIVGHEIVNVPMFSTNYEYLPELKFFAIRDLGGYYYGSHKTWEQAYAAKPVIFWMPVMFRNVIAEFYPKPEGYELTSVKDLSGIENSTTFNAEAAILQEFSPLVSYYLQGNIKYSEKGRPNMASLKKIQRTLALKEFYNDAGPALHPVRTMLVLGMLHGLKPNDISDSAPATIKKIFTQHFTKSRYPSAITNFIINQVKGVNYLSDIDYSSEAAHIFWEMMTKAPSSGWVTWENIKTYLNAHFYEPQPIGSYGYGRLYYEKEGGYGGKVMVDGSNLTNMLQWPFLKGCIFLLAAYGLLEMVYKTLNTQELGKTWFSEYDGLEAFKFTALGNYVLGKSSSYEPPVIENAAKLIFDEENLIIRAEGNLNLMTTLLGNYVEKISANRFAFRPTLFLKDCKNVKQIENKIALFRKSLNVKLPAFWEAELKQMVNNATAVAEQDTFFVFKINENDKHLLRTIAQDSQLKAITIKAEKFFVLVDKKNKAAFKNRLMELGYFVEA